jgi:3-deoxy-D-manno-octulosonic-acid transferase
MRWLYNILFLIGFVVSSPYYFLRLWRRGNWVKGFPQRFGRYDINLKQAITNRQILWVHAVSVGEMTVCAVLVEALQKRFPNLKIVVSTTTTTGMGELQKRLPPQVSKIYYPIDRRKFVARALAVFHPTAIILVETEIWPNFLWRAQELGTPVFLVNARISDRSYPGYRRWRSLFRGLFASFASVGAQSESNAARLLEVGCRPETVEVLGNLKFDTAKVDVRKPLDVGAMLAQAGVAPDALVIVAGSTHEGEEEILADQYLRLRQKFPGLFLVLVPRHFERARDIARVLSKKNLKLLYRSQLKPGLRLASGTVDVLLVNTTGELMNFYQHATVVFVGKSLTAQGGQNPIEPAALGKATVFGPNMQNFADIARLFVENDAALQVSSAAHLEQVLGELLATPARREQLGSAARKIVRENQGAVDRTVEMIVRHLKDEVHYVAPRP